MLSKTDKIFIAGHKGMVGSALLREFHRRQFNNLVTRTKAELDLTDQTAVRTFIQTEKPDCIVIAAAKVGGIHANNTYPAEFIYSNLMIESNLIHQAYLAGIQRIIFLGSSCIYPKVAEQPMKENALLSGLLEPTNEPYAIAKIAGIKLCESYNRQYGTHYRSLMPCNLYGPQDNFHLENSHVIPALIKKIHQAKLSGEDFVNVWGTGQVRREFLHVDDLANACLHVLLLSDEDYDKKVNPLCSHINVGFGIDITIRELAEALIEIIGFNGGIKFDVTKPDGPRQKLLDCSVVNSLGWKPSYGLEQGLKETFEWYLKNIDSARK